MGECRDWNRKPCNCPGLWLYISSHHPTATGKNIATTKCGSRPYRCLFPWLVHFFLGSRTSNLHAISYFTVSQITFGSTRTGAVSILYSQCSMQPGTELWFNSIYTQPAFSISLPGVNGWSQRSTIHKLGALGCRSVKIWNVSSTPPLLALHG